MIVELPKYKCHKVVRAARIVGFDTTGVDEVECVILTLEGHDHETYQVSVDPAFTRRNKIDIGSYYVVYEDGYASISPAAAFEGGYTLVGAEAAPMTRMTPEYVESLIESEQYVSGVDVANTLSCVTTCYLTLKNGATVVGCAHVIDPAQNVLERGRSAARRKSIDKIYDLEGYRLRVEFCKAAQ